MTISFWVGTVTVSTFSGLASHLTQFANSSNTTQQYSDKLSWLLNNGPAVSTQQKITKSHLWFEVLSMETWQSHSPEKKFSLQVRGSVTVDVFFKKIWWTQTCPFKGPLIPLFWTSDNVSYGFQSQSGQPYLHLVETYMMYILWDLPLLQHQPTSCWPVWWPVTFLHMHASAEVGCQTWLGDLQHSIHKSIFSFTLKWFCTVWMP